MRLNKNSSSDTEKIFINGIIYSIDDKNNIYEAMAVKNGIIQALGTNEEIKNYFVNKKEVIDLRFKVILPGFIDPHCHMSERMMIRKDEISLFEGNNKKDYLSLIQNYVDSHPEQKIIYGIGWRNFVFEEDNNCLNKYTEVFKGPSKEWLDEIKTDKPIILRSSDCHSLWLNTKAFEYFNISKDTKVYGGRIELSEQGELWGVLKENAINLINMDEIRTYKDKEYVNSFIKYQKILHAHGITTISSINQQDVKIPLEIYRRLEIMGKLKLRIIYGSTIVPQDICKRSVCEQIHELKRNRIIYKTELFDVSIAKFFADGIIENMTAYLFKPYGMIDDSFIGDNGQALWDNHELEEAIKMANRLEFNTHVHAVGDCACKLAIDGIEYSCKNNSSKNYRNSLIHADLVTKYYIRRMNVLKINAVVQPFWFYKHINLSKSQVLAIGIERAYRQQPIKSLISGGVTTAISSDNDILVETSPLNAIECAVLRNLYDFIPSGYPLHINMSDPRYRFNPNERISILEALRMVTINAAYILGREKEIGSLEIGKKADFIVLDKDIFNVKPLEISNINIQRTYFNGELVYLNE